MVQKIAVLKRFVTKLLRILIPECDQPSTPLGLSQL